MCAKGKCGGAWKIRVGKSTLIKCMVGLVDPDEGEIFVFGKTFWE